MKSAWPASAHPQNGSSSGSGEMFGSSGECTNSASSHSKLTIFPIRGRRMPNLAKMPLVLGHDVLRHEPDKRIALDPVLKQLRTCIAARDLRGFQSCDSSNKEGRIDGRNSLANNHYLSTVSRFGQRSPPRPISKVKSQFREVLTAKETRPFWPGTDRN